MTVSAADMTAAEARAALSGAVRMAARQVKKSLCQWENLTDEESDWQAEEFLRDFAGVVAPYEARLRAGE